MNSVISSIDKIKALNPKAVIISHYGVVHEGNTDSPKHGRNKVIGWHGIVIKNVEKVNN